MDNTIFNIILVSSLTNCFFTAFVVFHNLYFCKRIFSKYSLFLGYILILFCIGFIGLAWYDNIKASAHAVLDLFMQSTWFTFSVLMFSHIYRLEMFNRELELNSRTNRYLCNDFFNKTYIFKESFLKNVWDIKHIKDFIRNKIVFIEGVSWFLFLVNIICILIIKLGK